MAASAPAIHTIAPIQFAASKGRCFTYVSKQSKALQCCGERALRWSAGSSIVVKYEAPSLYWCDRSVAAVRVVAGSMRF